MSRFQFSLATPADDAQLRARMAENRMDGNIAVSFRREPAYFAGCRLQGDQVQVIVCREVASGRIVGLGNRCSSLMHVNGQALRAGYLSDLRGDPAYRNGTLLARGYRYLRSLHAAQPLPAYYSVIFDNNQAALRSLVGARAGLPAYIPLGRILTPAIHLDFKKPLLTVPQIALRRARREDLPALVAFLNQRLATRQFSPVYREDDFLPGGRCVGLTPEDFFIATQDGRIVGTLAAWDQSAVRQTHIERYSPPLAAVRPFYNLAAAMTPLKPLPPVGSRIPSLYFCCIGIMHDDVDIFRALLRFAYHHVRQGQWHYAIAALHEHDPLAVVLKEYRQIAAAGLLYRVDFSGADASEHAAAMALDDRIPYIEMALA